MMQARAMVMGKSGECRDLRLGNPRWARSIHALFTETANAYSEKTAIIDAGGQLSYRELMQASDVIAGHLRAALIGPGALVGLCSEASAWSIAAILGILKVGAAYVPFDPSYPEKLLSFIRQDSAPSAMLLSRRQRDLSGSKGLWAGATLVIEDLLAEPPIDPFTGDAEVNADELAYVMYTSGSTGRPKGVMIPHRAIARLVIDNDYARFADDEVFLQQAPLAFDASTFEIWGALLNGGTLAIPGFGRASLDDIARAIRQFHVTTLWLTAGLFHLMVDHRLEALRPLRQLLAGGDVLSAAHVRKLRQALPNCRLINGYGPTENTTFTTCYTVSDNADAFGDRVPIGTAIAGTSIHILDENLRRLPNGEEGELYAGGVGLAHGYLNRPDLTADRFIVDPFDDQLGGRLYRTGDRVRRRADGNLEFLGRIDRQIKINGKRVELDEIEATVRRSGLVGDVATFVRESPDEHRSIALCTTPNAAGDLTVDKLRRFIAAELPDYMMPAQIRILARLPLSPTGKLDRSALAETIRRDETISVAPVGQLARKVHDAWKSALGTDAFGIDDNFFDLGGTSLQLVGIHAALQETVGRVLPLVELFAYPTVRALARWLEQGNQFNDVSHKQQDAASRRNAALLQARRARERNLS